MGHLRLGRLPKTLRWQAVVGLLTESPDDVLGIACATGAAANARLRRLGSDPSLVYCFWLLTRLMAASREEDFSAALNRLDIGISVFHHQVQHLALSLSSTSESARKSRGIPNPATPANWRHSRSGGHSLRRLVNTVGRCSVVPLMMSSSHSVATPRRSGWVIWHVAISPTISLGPFNPSSSGSCRIVLELALDSPRSVAALGSVRR